MCRLEIKKIGSSLDFYALSYVWGSDVTNETIVCNDQHMALTQSVYEVLSAYHSFSIGHCMPIWIDAVCIDQKDKSEKELEVSRMDDSYR
jgi:hypothetical protein